MRWTVGYDATIEIHLGVEGESQAIEEAEPMIRGIREQEWPLPEGVELAIGGMLYLSNRETGVEILK